MTDKRRHPRTPIDVPLFFNVKGEPDERDGTGKDISIGGMFMSAPNPAPFGAEITIQLSLPGSDEVLVVAGIVRWVRHGGMGIQFGLLGVLETHVITEVARRYAEAKEG